ncbi:CHAP domain-containing protein [Novosphingobium sp. TH158]|uniref:CHAP domain-containing protein n=1 Tax=Novosphingobium sp. TH158 TaxID=2067455 RepID=UPI0020B14B46|nr:CHAP domain-containing protein [Novosphingobium sp. TH158]
MGQSAGTETAIAGAAGMSALQLMMLQCVPYARTVSGVQIYGDAHTWWNQAAGKYARGDRPKIGAVMAFKPYGRMELGHVAAVSRIIDSRTVLLRHANWSPINGARGQIEDDVRAIDVSENNDWSKVRVWFAPLQDIGGTAWPVHGFIYNEKPGKKDKLSNREDKPKPSLLDEVTSTPAKKQKLPPIDPRYAADPIGAIIAESLRARRK